MAIVHVSAAQTPPACTYPSDVSTQIHAKPELFTRAMPTVSTRATTYKYPIRNPRRPIQSSKTFSDFMCQKYTGNPPPWEVLVLVGYYLDPRTLAIASCVSRPWSISMSLDHLWQPLCSAHYPSLNNLKLACPSLPYCRLYAMARAATKRRLKLPSKPCISLEALLFVVDLRTSSGASVVTLAKPVNEIHVGANELFMFDVVAVCSERSPGVRARELDGQEIRITWNVVLRGWEAVFTMMDWWGKLSFVPGVEESWFSEELPLPGCSCCKYVGSGIVADLKLKLGFCSKGGSKEGGEDDDDDDGKRVQVDKVSAGMLSISSWRYVSLDDGLRYLQHFLLPCPSCTK